MKLESDITKKAMAVKQQLLSLKEAGSITLLEKEWAKYKYLVLGKNPNGYKAIRNLLKDKSAYPSEEFYRIIDESIIMPENIGYEINAAQHVFGYFRRNASSKEKTEVIGLIEKYKNEKASLSHVKNSLLNLAIKYDVVFLTESYYFLNI